MIRRLIQNLILVFAISTISHQYSYACTCAYAGEFTEYSKEQTVIRGTVNSYGPKLRHGEKLYKTMTVNVDELVQGSFRHSTIEFVGDPGHLCLTYVDSDVYPIGSEHLFTVFQEEKKQGLGGCGEVSVSIIDGKVEGAKYSDLPPYNQIEYSIEYNSFVTNLTQPPTSVESSPVATKQPPIKNKPWWKIW